MNSGLSRAREPLTPTILLGIGLGGFVDGILLHQVLGWHNMMSNAVPPASLEALRFNVWWDGLFHVFAWLVTALGVVLFWRAARRGQSPAASRFTGGLLIGFALFNLVEGTLNHHVLEIHNVREVADPLPWNIGFLALSGLMLVIGLLLARKDARDSVTASRPARP
jgi:uncharacterized membrane protein